MRRLTLRRRLVLGIVALLAAVTAVIGVVSVVALRGFLMDRLDTQLAAATERSQGSFSGDSPTPDTFLAIGGQSSGTFGAVIRGGLLVSPAVLDIEGRPVSIERSDLLPLFDLPRDGTPTTVRLGSELGDYRMVAVQSGLDGDTLLIGLPLRDVQSTVSQLGWVIAGIGGAGVLLAAFVGALVVRLALRPLERVTQTATDVSELPLDRDVALAVRVPDADSDPATEVGRVGSAFNRMLEHVGSALAAREASEHKLRTFVADASHELRTPLASIRGYAELTRRRAAELPEDVAHAIGRVESESVRMTALVEDLLLLARLDEGRGPDAAEVDLGRLVVDAVSDARAAGADHHWRIDVPERPVVVHGDAARLHQVVTNLLANARIHTPPGTTVIASLTSDEDRAVIEVADDGPGIDAALLPTVFERFVRGDGSRARASGSTGLGLAIVHAVVEAHGGRAEVTSEPGRTVFRIVLPRPGVTLES